MESLLTKVTQHAMNYAIRSGIAITSGYAFDQCARLLKTSDCHEKDELASLQKRLESKIRIISPAIDLIELISARGNSSIESAVTLTKSIRWDIQTLAQKLSNAAKNEELARIKSSKAKSKFHRDAELSLIITDMQTLLQKVEDSVPFINLAITASGVSLSSILPVTVSPSRLLQASTFLSSGDINYCDRVGCPVQIGPTFMLSLYMLFSGHASMSQSGDQLRGVIWKEVMHKAHLKLIRTPISQLFSFPFSNSDKDTVSNSGMLCAKRLTDEFAYQLVIIEDFDDGRVHDNSESAIESVGDIEKAGIRDVIPVHEVSKLFYADTGKVLNLGSDDDSNRPVLLLKRDSNACPPRRMMENELGETYENSRNVDCLPTFKDDCQWRLPAGLDPEWMAFEVYNEEQDSDTESEIDLVVSSEPLISGGGKRGNSLDPKMLSALSELNFTSSSPLLSCQAENSTKRAQSLEPNVLIPPDQPSPATPKVRTSLALLEMLIRLASLQQFQQASHLTINDELLNFFLEDSSTTGAATGDADARKRIRMEARRRVGFDPYDESPIKRRSKHYSSAGETYSPVMNSNPETPGRNSSSTLAQDETPNSL